MKKIAIFAAILSIGLSCMAQTGPGWQRIRAKQNFVDSVKIAKDVDITGVLRVGGVAITSTAGELNALQGILVTSTQLNHLAGVSGNIQSQLNGKLAIADTSGMLNPYIARGDTAVMLGPYALDSQVALKENALGNPASNGYLLSSTTGGIRSWVPPSSGMTYPGAGIALSTGSAWAGSITNNSANWNTAYGWGNHASAGYAPLASPVFTGTPRISTDTVATRAYARVSGMVYPAAGIPLSSGTGWTTSITNNSTNWNTAYTERRQWDGSASNLVPATGRTSLGATTVGSSLFTLANPSAIRYLRTNADNSVTAITAGTLKTELAINNVTNESKTTMFNNPIFTGTVSMPSPFYLGGTSVSTTAAQLNYLSTATGKTGTGTIVFNNSPLFTNQITLPPTTWLPSGAELNWNSGDVTLTHSPTAPGQLTLAGGNLSLGSNTLYVTGPIGSTTDRVSKGWFSDIESANWPTVAGTSIDATFAPKANPTFTGTVTLPSTTSIGNVSSTEIGYLDGVTSSIQTQINGKESSLGNPSTDGYVLSSTALGVRSWIPPGSGGGMVYPAAGIAVSTGTAWGTSITNNSANWNTAYTERRHWDGGATNLVPATGRTSLGATTVGSNLFTLPNPNAIRYLRTAADNSITTLTAAEVKSDLALTASDVGLANVTNESKATMFTNPTFTGTVTLPSPFTLGSTSVTTTGTRLNYLSAATGTTGTGNLVFSASPTFTGTVTGTFSGDLTGNVSGNAGTVTGFTRNSGTLTLSGGHGITVTTTGTTSVTLPTSGTLANTTDVENTVDTYIANADVGIMGADSTGNAPYNYVTRKALRDTVALHSNHFLDELNAMGSKIVAIPVGASCPFITNKSWADQTAYWQAFYLPYPKTITGVKWLQRTQGDYTAEDYNVIGLYTVSGSTYTQVRVTANNGDLWKGSSYSLQTVAFPTPYQADAGLYYVAWTYNVSAGATAPNIYCWNGSVGVSQLITGSHRLSGTVSAQTNLPATETATDLTAADVVYGIWLY